MADDTLSLANLEPVFNGMPVIVRLTSGQDILCTLYQSTQDDDPRMIMERPLRVVSEEIMQPVGDNKNLYASGETVYTKVRTRFDRWMTLSDVFMFPIFSDHIISIAPLSEDYVNAYMEWAEQLYSAGPQSIYTTNTTATHTTPAPSISGNTAEDIRQSYFDFVLHNFIPKGKPS